MRACPGLVALLLTAIASSAFAQEETAAPAFSLSSSQIWSTRDQPSISLLFREVPHLDFRVYRVNDPVRFMSGLRDPHTLGSPEPIVPQERTIIERIAAWKAARRAEVRAFLRRQLSPDYRAARRRSTDAQQIVRRQTVGYQQFAQVPLLNEAQLVSAWREMLPRVRDPEARRLPLDLPGAGLFVVEAVFTHLRAYTLVVVSDVGVVTKAAPAQLVFFAGDRFSGEPRADCAVAVLANRTVGATGTTSADGLFETTLGAAPDEGVVAVTRCAGDVVVSAPGAWYLRETGRELVGYVYTDRPVYRPGHTVHLKAILRWNDRGLLRPFDGGEVEIVVSDPTDKVIVRERGAVDGFGAVFTSLAVPADGALGTYFVRINSGDRQATGAFDVQEYRKPDFEVSVTSAERFVVQGDEVEARIQARYYFGQPVAGARVRYVVYRAPYYSPFRWVDAGDEPESDGYAWAGDQVSEDEVTLDARGEATVRLPAPVDPDGNDLTLRVEARVADSTGREVSGHALVHATQGRYLIAARAEPGMLRAGDAATVVVRAVDYLGRVQAGIRLTASLERIVYPPGTWQPQGIPVAGGEMQTDDEGRARWAVTVPSPGGNYRFVVRGESAGRPVVTRVWLWVVDPGEPTWDSGERLLELVADRASYAPGDVARLALKGDAPTAAAIFVTKEAHTTSWARVLRQDQQAAIEVPIDEHDIGDVWVHVAFMRDDRLYRAERRLRVPPAMRALRVDVEPAARIVRPRDPGLVTVRTFDAAGQPVRAQVSLGVVDEAVYGVKADATPDPLRFFYRRSYARVGTSFSREYSFVGYSGTDNLQLAQRRRPLALADFKAEPPERAEVRKDFPDAIFWIADLVTGADGTATVRLTYPDSLTTWRMTARAITPDTRAGATIARATTTKDVIVRVATPRFLVEGDRAEIPVVAHNYLPDARALDVAVEKAGLAWTTPPPASVRADVASGGEFLSSWAVTADRVGRASMTARATAGPDDDAMQATLPVLPFGLARERGVAGALRDQNLATTTLEIAEPSNPASREIRVSVAPSLAGSMLGALDYLTSYPYGCTEQTLSSFLPNLLVTRALSELGLAPTERLASLDRMSADGLRRLLDLQQDDGAWGWWRTDRPHPFMTAYAVFGLLEAQAAGLSVERGALTRGVAAVARLHGEYPRAVPELKAYLVHVLALAAEHGVDPADSTGFDTRAALDDVWSARSRMSAYGRALLVLALASAGDERAGTLADELGASAETKGELAWWRSDDDPLLDDWADTSVEATATAVKALARVRPDHPLLEGAVRWLVANRGSGAYWHTTKQTAMALYGLLDFVTARNERPATVSVEVTVNEGLAGRHTFTPASWTRPDPIVFTVEGRPGANDVRITRDGDGAVYWSAAARYHDTTEPVVREGTRQLALSRQYRRLVAITQEGRIVYRELPFDGTAGVGDVLLVRLTLAGSADWRYLVIEDPIPAGTEPVTDRALYRLEKPAPWWDAWWDGGRREYRDNRVVFFEPRLEEGRADYYYLLKVVTPGEYRAMPAQVAPMYVPDVSASSSTVRVRVDAATPAAGRGEGAAR